jgi:hypothetical protein
MEELVPIVPSEGTVPVGRMRNKRKVKIVDSE